MGNRSVLCEFNVDLSTGEWGISALLDQTFIDPVQYDDFTLDHCLRQFIVSMTVEC